MSGVGKLKAKGDDIGGFLFPFHDHGWLNEVGIVCHPNLVGELGGWLGEGVDFFCEVDAHGAPGDAAAASDTSGHAELINPRGELMREPHAIAVFGCRSEIFPMNIAMVGCEAGVPHPGMFGLLKV